MTPFRTMRTSPENFYPNITDEYRATIRDLFPFEKKLSYDYLEPYEDPFDQEQPEYQYLPSRPSRPIEEGCALSILSLFFSTKTSSFVRYIPCYDATDASSSWTNSRKFEFAEVGVEESLKDKKYVLVVCVFVPMRWSQVMIGDLIRLSLLSSELLISHPEFEMVIVAKMRKDEITGDYYDKDTFDHFMSSAFPGRLAVPYFSADARDLLCQKLRFDGQLTGILVDNDRRHPTRRVLMDDVGHFVNVYSNIGFPLTLERLCNPVEIPKHKSLAWALGCDPSFHLTNVDSSKQMSVGQLNEKVVGLYLCQHGDRLKSIENVHRQCRQKGLDLEVIFLCLPSIESADPRVFQDELFAFARESGLDISSWWVVPFRISLLVRLWDLVEIKFSYSDAMVIFGPNSRYTDRNGGDIAHYFGVSAYPFRRKTIVHQYVAKAKEVTLGSLLRFENPPLLIGPRGKKMPLSHLEGKNVLVYVDLYPPWREYTCDLLKAWYATYRENRGRSRFEFVLVTDSKAVHPLFEKPPGGLGPLRCIVSSEHSKFLLEHGAFFKAIGEGRVKTGLDPPAVMAFGKDGHMNMLNALEFLAPRGLLGRNKDPFDPKSRNLGYAVIYMLAEWLDFMRGYKGTRA